MRAELSDTRSERGQALVEFALVLPIFSLLLFAIIQFGITFNHYLAVTDSVRAGARQGAVGRFSTAPTDATIAAVRKASPDLDQSALEVGVSTPAGWTRGADVTVTASYPYEIDLFGVALKSGRLQSTVTERIE
jgi:Flp pilus assembly protein TadG